MKNALSGAVDGLPIEKVWSPMNPDTIDEVYLRHCLEALDSLPTLPAIASEAIRRALNPDTWSLNPEPEAHQHRLNELLVFVVDGGVD